MARLKKSTPVKAATAAAETTKEKIVKKPAAKKTEEIYLQAGGMEWNVSGCKERVIAAFTADGRKSSSVKKLVMYLKPEEGKAYYVINDSENGSISL